LAPADPTEKLFVKCRRELRFLESVIERVCWKFQEESLRGLSHKFKSSGLLYREFAVQLGIFDKWMMAEREEEEGEEAAGSSSSVPVSASASACPPTTNDTDTDTAAEATTH